MRIFVNSSRPFLFYRPQLIVCLFLHHLKFVCCHFCRASFSAILKEGIEEDICTNLWLKAVLTLKSVPNMLISIHLLK